LWAAESGPQEKNPMIYTNEQRANEVATQLNERRGYARSKAVLTEAGWTVVTSYVFGVSGPVPATQETPVYCVDCGAETELDCICDDLNFADGCGGCGGCGCCGCGAHNEI
jgi:hypothetical protein